MQKERQLLPETNVIYIMNESFADPLELEGLDLQSDPIPFTRALMDTSYSGELLSQGYGGGTANIEFEALTGFSMEPFAANITTPIRISCPCKMIFLPSCPVWKKPASVPQRSIPTIRPCISGWRTMRLWVLIPSSTRTR